MHLKGEGDMRRLAVMMLVIVTSSSAVAAETTPLFENSDFEKGDLTNWKAEGAAFKFQPTKGDNPTARGRKDASKHQGEFWIGTYEQYNGKTGKPGDTQGDGITGKLTSVEFTITGDYLNFLVGGGGHVGTCVRLQCDDKEYYLSSGFSSETMRSISADVKPFKGKKAQLIIIDNATGGWGHVNADDFTASDAAIGEVRKPIEASKMELVAAGGHEFISDNPEDDPYPASTTISDTARSSTSPQSGSGPTTPTAWSTTTGSTTCSCSTIPGGSIGAT